MTESMRRAQVTGNAPRSIVSATGLGGGGNGLPDVKPYRHPGWVNDMPSAADWPRDADRQEAIRQGRLRMLAAQRQRDALTAEGRCPGCSYPLDSCVHHVACEDGT